MRAMVLAAGLGLRLRPLTRFLPKPLVPFLNEPLIDWVLDELERAGVEQCVVNAHHLPDLLAAHLARRGRGPNMLISREPEILGTGGGLLQARPLLGAATVLVQNSDCVLSPDYAALLRQHAASGAPATLLLKRCPEQARYGAVLVNSAGRVLDIAGLLGATAPAADAGMFVGVHALEPAILDHAPPGRPAFDIVRELYLPLLRSGAELRAAFYDGPFVDVGSIKSYLAANLQGLESAVALYPRALQGHQNPQPGAYVHPDAQLEQGVELRSPLLVGAGCRVAAGARLGPAAILGRNSEIGAGALIERSVVLPGSRVPACFEAVGRLIMPRGRADA